MFVLHEVSIKGRWKDSMGVLKRSIKTVRCGRLSDENGDLEEGPDTLGHDVKQNSKIACGDITIVTWECTDVFIFSRSKGSLMSTYIPNCESRFIRY